MSVEPIEEDDMLSEEEQEEADRNFLIPLFRFSNAEIDKSEHGTYQIYTEGMLNQVRIDTINQKFWIRRLEPFYHGLFIELVRK